MINIINSTCKVAVTGGQAEMVLGVQFSWIFQLEFIKEGRNNFTFNSYIGLEHNFFQKDKMGKVNYEIFGWDKVSNDWLKWLDK